MKVFRRICGYCFVIIWERTLLSFSYGLSLNIRIVRCLFPYVISTTTTTRPLTKSHSCAFICFINMIYSIVVKQNPPVHLFCSGKIPFCSFSVSSHALQKSWFLFITSDDCLPWQMHQLTLKQTLHRLQFSSQTLLFCYYDTFIYCVRLQIKRFE